MQYDKDLKSKIGLNYNLDNRVLVISLVKASHLHSGLRMHVYAAGTGKMGAHHDSCNNQYEDKEEQKYSILFAMKDFNFFSL
jgi:hypothetical protein